MKKRSYIFLALPNLIFRKSVHWETRPVFYNIDEIAPELRLLEENFAEIKSEHDRIRCYLESAPSYHELDKYQSHISYSKNKKKYWKMFFLEAMGRKAHNNRKVCPVISNLIDKIPNVFQVSISILEAGKSIPPHHSPYDGYLRCHLAIEVPLMDPPKMRIKDVWLTWEEGKAVLFDDTWEHEIVNYSQSSRTVLIVDIFRPMGPYARLINKFMIKVMKYTYARYLISKAEVI